MKYNYGAGIGAKLYKALKTKDDEFYTIYELFEYYVNKYLLDKLNDKVIYCPCDSELSNIIKVLLDKKETLQYKELIYTSDDFRTHGDLFDKADVIITNPPFSLMPEFILFLKQHNNVFFIYGGNMSMYKKYMVDDIINGNMIYFLYDAKAGTVYNKFIRPDGTEKIVCYNLYTNIPGLNYDAYSEHLNGTVLSDIEDTWGYLDNTKILNVKNWLYYPIDYDGIAAVSPVKYNKWKNYFDIVEYKTTKISKYLKVNGKNIFVRWFVKLKGSDAKLEDYITDCKSTELF